MQKHELTMSYMTQLHFLFSESLSRAATTASFTKVLLLITAPSVKANGASRLQLTGF
jgi:hypothetical protein